MTPKPSWSRENTIAVIAIAVSVVGILLSLFSPDVRHFLHLSQSDGANQGLVASNLAQGETNVASTPKPTQQNQQPILKHHYQGTNTNRYTDTFDLYLDGNGSGFLSFKTDIEESGKVDNVSLQGGIISFVLHPGNDKSAYYTFTGTYDSTTNSVINGKYCYIHDTCGATWSMVATG